jgi:hypothetical protein
MSTTLFSNKKKKISKQANNVKQCLREISQHGENKGCCSFQVEQQSEGTYIVSSGAFAATRSGLQRIAKAT